MKATGPNQESRRGGTAAPRFSEGAKGLPARYLTPGLPRRRAPSEVNFPPAEGDRALRTPHLTLHPQESSLLPAVTRCRLEARPAPFITRRPGRRSPSPSPATRRHGPRGGRGDPDGEVGKRRDPDPSGLRRWAPSPETAMHHGSGVGARMPPGGDGDPSRSAGPTRTRPLAQPRQLPAAAQGRQVPGPTARALPGPPPHTPPAAMFEAAGCGAGTGGGGDGTAVRRRGPTLPASLPPSVRYSREITAQRVG